MKVEIEIPDETVALAVKEAGARALGLNWENRCNGPVAKTINTLAAEQMNAAIAAMDIGAIVADQVEKMAKPMVIDEIRRKLAAEAKKAAAAAVKEITR